MKIILSENADAVLIPTDVKEEQEPRNVPFLLNGKYFTIKHIEKSSNKVEAICRFCQNEYRATLSSTTNFLNHLRRTHPTKAREYQNLMKKHLGMSYSQSKTFKVQARDRKKQS